MKKYNTVDLTDALSNEKLIESLMPKAHSFIIPSIERSMILGKLYNHSDEVISYSLDKIIKSHRVGLGKRLLRMTRKEFQNFIRTQINRDRKGLPNLLENVRMLIVIIGSNHNRITVRVTDVGMTMYTRFKGVTMIMNSVMDGNKLTPTFTWQIKTKINAPNKHLKHTFNLCG